MVKEYPKDTVIIFQFGRSFDIPSLSPYALRFETWCRAAGIKYKVINNFHLTNLYFLFLLNLYLQILSILRTSLLPNYLVRVSYLI